MKDSNLNRRFVKRYSTAFYYQDEEEFSRILDKRRLNANDLTSLLNWKSTRYGKHVRMVLNKNLQLLNKMRRTKGIREDQINRLVRKAYPGYPDSSPVFGTFIKHIVDPVRFPILDQYAHRAFHEFSTDSSVPKYPKCSVSNMECYAKYAKWFDKESTRLGVTGKKLDEALWAFGRELSEDDE